MKESEERKEGKKLKEGRKAKEEEERRMKGEVDGGRKEGRW